MTPALREKSVDCQVSLDDSSAWMGWEMKIRCGGWVCLVYIPYHHDVVLLLLRWFVWLDRGTREWGHGFGWVGWMLWLAVHVVCICVDFVIDDV